MATHEIKGFLTQTNYRDTEPVIGFSMYRPNPKYSPDTVVIREHSFEVDVSDDFDPRPSLIAALEEQKRQARVEFAAMVMKIDQRISELQAIEFSGSAS